MSAAIISASGTIRRLRSRRTLNSQRLNRQRQNETRGGLDRLGSGGVCGTRKPARRFAARRCVGNGATRLPHAVRDQHRRERQRKRFRSVTRRSHIDEGTDDER